MFRWGVSWSYIWAERVAAIPQAPCEGAGRAAREGAERAAGPRRMVRPPRGAQPRHRGAGGREGGAGGVGGGGGVRAGGGRIPEQRRV